MAKRFGFSPAGFSRFFAREFGKPFVRYLAELRVGRASHLLVEKESKIAEIARQSGFGTAASLNRHFRTVKGATPTAYRRLGRQVEHRQ
jgi:transcriptional regulator GlxA family with amidase domain